LRQFGATLAGQFRIRPAQIVSSHTLTQVVGVLAHHIVNCLRGDAVTNEVATFVDRSKCPAGLDRCRYALRFGDEKVDDYQGGNRDTNVRIAFNSPFRPFVLATTSVGQEGLDFHQYCHRDEMSPMFGRKGAK